MRRHGVLLVLLPFLAFSEYSATAAPLNYSETISGDLPGNLNPLPIFIFGIGVNTVSGQLGIPVAAFDFDSFAFVIPAGTKLIGGRIEVSDFRGDILSCNWTLRTGSAAYPAGSRIWEYHVPSPGGVELLIPLGPGVYTFSNPSFAIRGDLRSLADYSIALTLVPEPSTLALAASTLLALSLIRRRRAL